MKRRKRRIQEPTRVGCPQWTDPRIVSDVFGSYTGVPLDPEEKPVQDADDL